MGGMQMNPITETIGGSDPALQLGDKPPAELEVSRTIWTALKSQRLAHETPVLYNAVLELERRVIELEARLGASGTAAE